MNNAPRRPGDLHPDLKVARFFPPVTLRPLVVHLIRSLLPRMKPPRLPEGVTVEEREVPGLEGQPPVRVRILSPQARRGPVPALYFMHGGGFMIGNALQDEAANAEVVEELGIIVVSVDYRLAPEHPYPAPLDDCYAGLSWLHENAAALGVDPDRIAIGGESAGGCLAAGLTLLARDRGLLKPAFQLLVYPVLDDRSADQAYIDQRTTRVWSPANFPIAWKAYLGYEPGGETTPVYAAPARATDLSGLPPTWIGVGTLDLFHDEDVAYAQRLRAQGVPCDLTIIPGAFHTFELFLPNAPVSRAFRRQQRDALRAGLGLST